LDASLSNASVGGFPLCLSVFILYVKFLKLIRVKSVVPRVYYLKDVVSFIDEIKEVDYINDERRGIRQEASEFLFRHFTFKK